MMTHLGVHQHPHQPGEQGFHNRLSPTNIIAPLTPVMRLALAETILAAASGKPNNQLEQDLEAAPWPTVNARHAASNPGLTEQYVRSLLDINSLTTDSTLATMIANRISELRRGDPHDNPSDGMMCGCGG